jgi:flagellar hook-basal body complex protein FliE
MIEAVGSVAGLGTLAPALVQGPAQPAAISQNFGNWFVRELAQVNQQLSRVDADSQALASGQAVSLHQVMINLEEAKLSFDLLAQVRNRLLESYQEVMRTQV